MQCCTYRECNREQVGSCAQACYVNTRCARGKVGVVLGLRMGSSGGIPYEFSGYASNLLVAQLCDKLVILTGSVSWSLQN